MSDLGNSGVGSDPPNHVRSERSFDDGVSFEPVHRDTVSGQIRRQLMHRIATGELRPGQRMPSERDLSERFAVARTSVREAMQGLVSLGLVERRGNRSFVVERLPDVVVDQAGDDKSFVAELFETRRLLEGPLFELAAVRADEEDRCRVEAVMARFEGVSDIDAFRRLDREFHTTIATCCGNALLIEVYSKVLDRLFRSKEFENLLQSETNSGPVRELIASAIDGHRTIAEAFLAGDAATVRAEVDAHLTTVEQSMLEKLN